MTEPVSKKSGTYFRQERARKKELQNELSSKIKPLENFFRKIPVRVDVSTDQQIQCSSQNNEYLNSQNSDTASIDINENLIGCNQLPSSPDPFPCVCVANSEPKQSVDDSDEAFVGVIDDNPCHWPVSDPKFVKYFIRNRPEQCVENLNFSGSKREYSGRNRHCTANLFYKKRINGEIVKRTWIFYSELSGKIFCIYCKLFADDKYSGSGSFVSDGFNDWKHSIKIEEHETTKNHQSAAYIFARRSHEFGSIMTDLEKQILDDNNYLMAILKRIVSAIQFLSSRGLAFRGNDEEIGSNYNGNYLGVLELLAEYDPLLRSHIERYANKGKGNVSYLSSTIADEFIAIMASEVRKTIIESIRRSKYFALIVDSTPDISHVDQLTICKRYVDDNGCAIERFLVFLENTGHKATQMEVAIINYIKTTGLVISDCRGQSYDNAKNMSGIYGGLQALIKEMCSLAEYVPCSPHSLNLSLEHAVEDNPDIARFFLFIQNIYVFFSASTKRWSILKIYLEKHHIEKKQSNPQERLLVPKKLSGTRWSARFDSCRALKAGYQSYVSALQQIFEAPDEKKVTQIEAEALYREFYKLETAVLLEFWTAILQRANMTSKSLQSPWIDLETSTKLYKSLLLFIRDLRNEVEFRNFVDKGKILVKSCPGWESKNPELTFNCYDKRVPKRNTRYDVGKSSETVFSFFEKYKISIFYSSLDHMTSDLAHQIETYETVLLPFSFLFKLTELSDTEIFDCSKRLQNIYNNDLDHELSDECKQFKFFMADINAAIEKEIQDSNRRGIDEMRTLEEASKGKSKLLSKPSRMLQYIRIHKLKSTFPNLEVALRIFECIAVANATGERSFSGLKHIKSPHRSVLGEEKMNDLAVMYINNDITKNIDSDIIINNFMESKGRKGLKF